MEEIKFNKIEGNADGMDGVVFNFAHFFKDYYRFNIELDNRKEGKISSFILMSREELNDFIVKLQTVKEEVNS